MSYIGTNSFLLNIQKGNVAGHSLRTIVFRNPNIRSAYEDVWGGGGTMIYPLAAETWEIVSSSANDASGGSGAETVLVSSLDSSYNVQTQAVSLNGTTPVTLTGTHFRPDGAAVILSGSGQTNDGDITISNQASGDARQVIPESFGASQDCHFTVPDGFTAYSWTVVFNYPAGEYGDVAGEIMPFGTNTWIKSGEFHITESLATLNLEAQFVVTEKSDVRFVGTADPNGSIVNGVLVSVIIDNNYL